MIKKIMINSMLLAACVPLGDNKIFAGQMESRKGFVPPEGKVLLIIGQDKQTIDDYVKDLGRVPAGLMGYTSVQRAEGIYEEIDHGGGIQHLQYEVEKYPDTVMQVGLYMVDVLDEIIKGVYDENIEKIGNWIITSKRPVYLRIGYEFDGPHNQYDPGLYVKAYRYIVDKFNDMQIKNIAYVWHSYANHTDIPVTEWYPGDEYVDWIGLSYFNSEQSFIEGIAQLARQKNKPLMIAEAAPFGIDVRYTKEVLKKWYGPFFKFIQDNGVKAISYINCDWESLPMWKGQGWKDSRVQINPDVKQSWLSETSKNKYIKSSVKLFNILGLEKRGF
jgi:hypothetical protein